MAAPRLRLADEDGRALRTDQARTVIEVRLLEVGDGQGDVAIRTNDPCVEVLRHDCIFIQLFGRRNTVCGFHSAVADRGAAQSGTSCCNRLLVSRGTRPYRSTHALSPNSLTTHLPPLRSSESPALPPRGFHFVVGLHKSFLQCALPRGTLSTPPAHVNCPPGARTDRLGEMHGQGQSLCCCG